MGVFIVPKTGICAWSIWSTAFDIQLRLNIYIYIYIHVTETPHERHGVSNQWHIGCSDVPHHLPSSWVKTTGGRGIPLIEICNADIFCRKIFSEWSLKMRLSQAQNYCLKSWFHFINYKVSSYWTKALPQSIDIKTYCHMIVFRTIMMLHNFVPKCDSLLSEVPCWSIS